MHRRRISWTSIRNFIGTPSLRISSARSVISTSHRADAGGSRASTVTYFVPSVIRAFRDHSRSPCCFESFAGNHVAALIGDGLAADSWRPDLLHGQDWHAALVPALMASRPRPRPAM